MSNRDTAWKILDDCITCFPQKVKDDFDEMIRRKREIITYRPKQVNGNVRAPDANQLEKIRNDFWDANTQLNENINRLITCLVDEFPLDKEKIDMEETIEEARALYRFAEIKNIESARAYEISDTLFPLLIARIALYVYRIPLTNGVNWRKFAKIYTVFAMAA